MPKKFYITTPIYYVNSVPHVGHALTMLVCDVTKRYRKMRGEEVVFLTGTDENGLKIIEAAAEAGESTQAFVDRISETFRDAAKVLNIDYDIFFRTTSEQHKKTVQALFTTLQERGHVYQDKYEGWYDVSAETFFKESDLVDGKSPDGNEVRWVSEDNYFFRLSAFGDQLLEHAEKNPEFWMPEGRKAEVVSFVKQGLRDICITRNNPGWGIPVPGDESKVIYVWFDALINYLSASGWPDTGWENLWPADVHWMAKEIFTRFHATLWPAMMLAAGLPLPKTVIAHGWFTFNDSKMSKSKGNVLAPAEIIADFTNIGCQPEVAVDVLRYALIRALPFESDSNFNQEEIEKFYSSELANDLGNALNRSVAMLHKYCGGKIPAEAISSDIVKVVEEAKSGVDGAFANHRLNEAQAAAMTVVQFINRYIAEVKPWDLAKTSDPGLPGVMVNLAYGLVSAADLLTPFIPSVSSAIRSQLGQSELAPHWSEVGNPSTLQTQQDIKQPTPLFPRREEKKMQPETPAPAAEIKEEPKYIDITDVMKLELKVGRILEAEALENSEKLVKLKVLIGEEKRQIMAGIRKSYEPANVVGMQVIVICNLKPRKLAGHESEGMILAADGPDGTAILLTPESEAPEGTSVH